MRITSLEVAAIVAIGLTTVQLQTPDPAQTGQSMRTSVARPDGSLLAVPQEKPAKQPRAREAVASN